MAALTWREVSAPQLSTRDLALAGQTVTTGFDRLGAMLNAREEALRTQATDAAIAERLAIQDPNKLGQINLTGLDRRVNARALVEADNQHQVNLAERMRNQEELTQMQAVAELGDEGARFIQLMGSGQREAAMAYAEEQAALDPRWGRVALGFTTQGEEIYDRFDQRRQTGERDEANAAYQRTSGEAAMMNARSNAATADARIGELSDARTARAEQIAAQEAAQRLARNPDMDEATARKWAAENLSPGQQAAFATSYTSYAETYAGLSPDQVAIAAQATAPLADVRATAEGQRAQALAASRAGRPEIDAIERYRTNPEYAEMTPDDAVAAIDQNINNVVLVGGPINPAAWGGAGGVYRQLREEGLTPGEIVAALDSGFGGRDFWSNFTTLTGGRESLREMARTIRETKTSGGYDQFIREEQRTLAPFDSDIAGVDRAINRIVQRVGRTSQVQTRTGENGETVIETTAPEVTTEEDRALLNRIMGRQGGETSRRGYIER
jgi:hypothetical protein